jgi:hypothetical protein
MKIVLLIMKEIYGKLMSMVIVLTCGSIGSEKLV